MQPATPRDARAERWIERLRTGERAAFDDVVRAFHAPLVGYLMRSVHSRAIAEDLVQEVFLRLWRNRSTLMPDGNLTTYLYSSARNQVRDQFRRWRATDARDATLAREQADVHTSWVGNDVDAQLDARAMAEALDGAVARLPERCREVWVLSREHGLSVAQVAETLGVSPNTVKTQLARALKVLREALRPFLLALIVVTGSQF